MTRCNYAQNVILMNGTINSGAKNVYVSRIVKFTKEIVKNILTNLKIGKRIIPNEQTKYEENRTKNSGNSHSITMVDNVNVVEKMKKNFSQLTILREGGISTDEKLSVIQVFMDGLKKTIIQLISKLYAIIATWQKVSMVYVLTN